MAVNYFAGKSKTWLETELAKAQAELAAGKTSNSGSSGDVAFSKQIQIKIKERIESLLYALYLIDPDTYPATSAIRVSRTKLVAYQG